VRFLEQPSQTPPSGNGREGRDSIRDLREIGKGTTSVVPQVRVVDVGLQPLRAAFPTILSASHSTVHNPKGNNNETRSN
jgi:hypothetical protein